MIDIAHIHPKTLEEKVDLYTKTFGAKGKKYSREEVKKALEYLSYHKAPKLPKDEDPNKPTLYVFRHGQTEDNANFIFCGWRDPNITATGRNQAIELSEKLKDKKLDLLVCSDQTRSIETMILAISENEDARDSEIQIDPRIKERNYGIYQGKSKLEYQLDDPEGLLKIRRDYYNLPPEGESLEMTCARVKDFCEEIVPLMKEHNLNVAVSCHGNSMRGFRQYFEGLSDEETAHIETPLGQDYAAYSV